MSMNRKNDPKFIMAYDRAMLRSGFVSLFWSIIEDQRKDGLTLVSLAKKLSTNKAQVTRWFKSDPNWTVNTIASLANALDVELVIKAKDRKTGRIYTTAGADDLYSMDTPATGADQHISEIVINRKPQGSEVTSIITTKVA